jgi:hypothetical protein
MVTAIEEALTLSKGTLTDIFDLLDSAVQARMERQAILAGENAPTLHVAVDEAVLHREFGGRQAMYDQLMHLIECVSERLTIQVVPSNMNPHCAGAFAIGTMENGGEVAYVETAVRGIVTSSRDDIEHLNGAWELIRSHAKSQHESLDLIKRTAEERWS